MSRVDNVILSFSIMEESYEGKPYVVFPIVEQINEWLVKHTGQRFGPDLAGVHEAYGGDKVLEAPMFVAAFNGLPEEAFLAFLRTLPWEEPENVRYIVKRQDDDAFQIVRL